MQKYLCDINLSDIPCAWQHIYDEALLEYPNGKNVEITDTEGNNYTFWANPVQYYQLFIQTFNKYKNQAQLSVKKKNFSSLNELFTETLEADVALYNLLNEWTMPIDIHNEFDPFNPYVYFKEKQYLNYKLYFNYNNFEFCNLRLINNPIKFDPQSKR